MAKKRDSKKEVEINIDCDLNLKFNIAEKFRLSAKHQSFIDMVMSPETKMSFLDGPAGTAKSFLAVKAALQMIQAKSVKSIIYIRSIAESASKSMGSLPGEVDDKFAPWAMPLYEKLGELVNPGICSQLISSGVVKCIPVNYIRGLTFNESCVIVDEAQNLTKRELITILTRFGHMSRYIVVGDTFQSDINGRSGFKPIYEAFQKADVVRDGFVTAKFGKSEIVRSKELRTIVKVLETIED